MLKLTTKAEARRAWREGTRRIAVTVDHYDSLPDGSGQTSAGWRDVFGFPTFDVLHERTAMWQHRGAGRVFYFMESS